MESAQIVRVSLANEALARAVGGVLNSPEECKKNLKPGTGRLTGSDSGNGKGDLTQLTKGDDVVLSTSTQNGDNIFKYSFDIIKMQLSGEGTLQKDSTDGDDAKKRTFTVYYKKRGVGSLSTLGDLECSADSQLGCYFYQCDLSYELDSSNEVKVCRSLTCVSGGGGVGAEIAGQMCELGEYLVGFTAGGAKICVDMSCDCEDMGSHEATCESNNWKLGLQGVKEEEGNMIPVCVRLLKVEGQTGKAKCDLGKFATGYDTNGDVICEEYTCPGGMEKDETDQKCKCPDVKPYWDGSKCIESSVHSCPATAPYSYNSRCVNSCPQTLPVVGRNKVCQSCMQVNPNTPYWNKRLKKCVSSCPTYYQNQHRIRRINYWSSTNNPDCFLSNACGEGETRTASGGCEVSCPSGSSYSCATCPPGTIATFTTFPNYLSSCISCPKHRPYLSGSTCVASCPSTKALDPVKKICVEKHWGCPPDRPKVGTNGQCEACPAGTYWKFVPSTQNFDHGPSQEAEYYRENYDDHYFCSSTCPSNQHKYDGRCVRTCPDDKPKVGANNVCEACPTGHHWNRITKTCNNCSSPTPYWSTLSEKCVSACPSGTTLNYARKACVGNDCPIDKPYKSGSSCVSACDRSYVYNNKCVNSCPAGSTAVSIRAWRSRRICVPLEECPDTTPYYSGSTASCVSTCPSDRQYKYNNICVSTCPSSTKVGANNVCEACPTNKPKVGANNVCEACSGTTPYWSGSACVSACPNDKRYKYNKTCVSACPPDKPKVGANNVCEACPPNKPYHKLSPQAPVGDGICVASCDGYEGISVTQENYTCSEWYSCTPQEGGSCCALKHNNYCVQYCPTSHPYSSSTGCVNSCPSNTILDTETRRCVTSCPAGQISRNNTCVANTCPATTYFDVPIGNCVATCPTNRPKKANNTCVESCPAERPRTGANNVCEACSGTTPYWSGSACVSACPTDKPHIDSENNHCISTCPADRPFKFKEKRGGKFVCIDDCIGNLVKGANKECVCPADKPYRYNGISFCVSSCVVPNHQATTDKWCIPNTQ